MELCFNYETQEYYCIECYRLNNETGYDIRFFKDANIPNEINRDIIEYIDIDYTNKDDNIITYLINKNEHYYNIINNYYNLIKELNYVIYMTYLSVILNFDSTPY